MRIFVVLSMGLLTAAAQSSGSAELGSFDEEHPRIFCGRNLANARMLYCLSNESEPQKRFVEVSPPGSSHPQWMSVWWPRVVRRPQYVHALRSKREPGLVDECCYKPCYVSELLNYC